MKTIIKISPSFDGDCSNFERNDNIDSLVNFSMKVHCEISNDKMLNIVEEIKKYQTCKEDFKNLSIVEAIGYCQSEWQEYKLYHNQPEGNDDLRLLIDELKKTFTHNNDYIVEKFEREYFNGKKFDSDPHYYTSFCIRHIEFPEEEDILKEYISIYGEDYDEVIIETNL